MILKPRRTPEAREPRRKPDASERNRQHKRVLMAFEIAKKTKKREEESRNPKKDDSPEERKQRKQSVGELAGFLLTTQREALDKMVRRDEEKQARAQKTASERKKSSPKTSETKKASSIVSGFTARVQKREREERHKKPEKQETHSKSDTRTPKERTRESRSDTKSSRLEGTKRREGSETTPQNMARIDSMEKFDRVQVNFPHLKMNKNYEKGRKAASEYYEGKKNGENVTKPVLLERVERLEIRRIYEYVNGRLPEVPIESMDAVDKLLDSNPEQRKQPKFVENYRKCQVYFAVKDDWSKIEKELAAEHTVSESTIGYYRRGDNESQLISKLRRTEEDRIIQEWARTQSLDEKTIENLKRIEPTKMERVIENRMKETRPVREIENTNVDDIVKTIEKMIVTDPETTSKVTLIDLQDLGVSTKQILEIERSLQSYFEDVRVGMTNGNLYIWTPDLNKDDMFNAWKNVYFYLSTRELTRMVEEVGDGLKLGDTLHDQVKNLNSLMKQMTSSSTNSVKIEDLGSRMLGESLHFNRDVLGLRTKDLEGIITKVAGWNGVGGIPNPKFLEGKELEIERARLYAILKSDGWVHSSRGVGYTETHSNRFDIVEKGLQAWGDIKLTRYNENRGRAYETRFPSPFWDALNFWGFPIGDKMMHNKGLGLDVDKLSFEAVKVYLGELTPEDGNFHSTTGFSWSRSVALKAGKRGEAYGFKSLLTPELANFVKEHGTHDEEKQRKVLRVSKLEELTKDSDSLVSSKAKKLKEIVLANPSKLIEDEVKMVQRLGIETSLEPRVIRFSLRTVRVTVYWNASTTIQKDAMKWAITCPPNDVRKRRSVKSWLKGRETSMDSVKQELRDTGIPYDEWWI